jgi:hypothetical protein
MCDSARYTSCKGRNEQNTHKVAKKWVPSAVFLQVLLTGWIFGLGDQLKLERTGPRRVNVMTTMIREARMSQLSSRYTISRREMHPYLAF